MTTIALIGAARQRAAVLRARAAVLEDGADAAMEVTRRAVLAECSRQRVRDAQHRAAKRAADAADAAYHAELREMLRASECWTAEWHAQRKARRARR